MTDLFEELRKKVESEAEGHPALGISAWDLRQLPAAQRNILRLVLREVQMTDSDLRSAVAAWPEAQRLRPQELDAALESLLQRFWLIRMGQDQIKTYRVNLRRKAGSKLGESIWERLERQIP